MEHKIKTEPEMTESRFEDQPCKAVAIVTGSDTVSTAIDCMRSLRHGLPLWCDIVIAYSTAPACVTDRVRVAAGNRRVTILESQTWQTQNQLRNRALAAVPPYDYYLFLDLDSRIEPGGLERCIETHSKTGADLIGAVVLYDASIDFGREGEKIIHFAGGECRFRPDADNRPGFERVHHWESRRFDDLCDEIGNQPWETELVEYHGVCLTRRAVEALTPLDVNLLAMENADLSLLACKQRFRRLIDPRFEVTYVRAAECLCDIRPYREHWGTDAVQESVRYFAKKHGVPSDAEFVLHQTQWDRQHYEDIGTVTRPSFPAPALTDLDAHPFAQTWPQLLHQLHRQGWSLREIDGVKQCHDVGRQLANGYYSTSDKPVIAHLIGTASILAAYGAPPILVESALVHTAYDEFGIGLDELGNGTVAKALTQRVGSNVDRLIRAYAQQNFRGVAPPKTEDALAFYPLDDARTLLVRVAKEIEGYLDGAAASISKDPNSGPLVEHARKILPVLGFDGLLRALECVMALSDALAASVPDSRANNCSESYRLLDRTTPDVLALPDQKWIEVGSFLRREGREADVAAAPAEFRYLCDGIRYEFLPEDFSKVLKSKAIFVLHKGRLVHQPQAALAVLLSATPIFANEVFVLFSKTGRSIEAEAQLHIGPINALARGIE